MVSPPGPDTIEGRELAEVAEEIRAVARAPELTATQSAGTLPPLGDLRWLTRTRASSCSPKREPRTGFTVDGLTPDAFELFHGHSWPGNVRELRNVVEHATILATGTLITARDAARALQGSLPSSSAAKTGGPSEPAELVNLLAALEKHHWHHDAPPPASGSAGARCTGSFASTGGFTV